VRRRTVRIRLARNLCRENITSLIVVSSLFQLANRGSLCVSKGRVPGSPTTPPPHPKTKSNSAELSLFDPVFPVAQSCQTRRPLMIARCRYALCAPSYAQVLDRG